MRLLTVLLLAASFAAAADNDLRRSPAGRAVDAYLQEAAAEPAPIGSDTRLSAAAQGGVWGWASLRLDLWYPAVDGSVDDAGGGPIDLAGELAIDDNEFAYVPRVLLSAGGVGTLIDAFLFETEGSGALTASVTIGGVTFNASEAVATDFDLNNVRGFLTVPVVKTDFLQIMLLGGLSYYDLHITMTGNVSGSATFAAQVPVPVIGVLGQAKFGPVLLEVEVSGLTISYDVYGLDYLDIQASVGFTFLKIVAVRAGYRYVALNGSIDDVDIDLTLDGFFIGGSVNF